ncbi:MAG: PH domain-containing protein [Defluviitaleaceae bacterium]|nr:PH domain-containing protein [Defluviitaleaceae bacterium]
MSPELQNFMQGLPMHITSVSDARALVKRQGGMTFLGGRSMRQTVQLIEPNERIYFFTHASFKFVERATGEETSGNGSIFLSERRLLIRVDFETRVLECSLCDILSVAASKGIVLGKVAFCTTDISMEFDILENQELIRQMFIHVAAIAPDVGAGAVSGAPSGQKAVVDCPGCSAAVIVVVGSVSKCEYCNRPVDSRGGGGIGDCPTHLGTVPGNLRTDSWACGCGAHAAGRFCSNCAAPRPDASRWNCHCGGVSEGRFCPNCGSQRV